MYRFSNKFMCACVCKTASRDLLAKILTQSLKFAKYSNTSIKEQVPNPQNLPEMNSAAPLRKNIPEAFKVNST